MAAFKHDVNDKWDKWHKPWRCHSMLRTFGGKVSIFNMMTFKTMTIFMLLPAIVTFFWHISSPWKWWWSQFDLWCNRFISNPNVATLCVCIFTMNLENGCVYFILIYCTPSPIFAWQSGHPPMHHTWATCPPINFFFF